MVNLDNGKVFKKSHDLENPSDAFNSCLTRVQTLFNETQRRRREITVNEISNAPDIVEVHTGFCPYAQYKSQNLNVVLDIEMKDNPSPNTHKIASELAIVLDVSGSMHGKPLEYSKQAIVEVVNSLTENDYLHFITYSDNSKLIFNGYMTEENKKQAKISIMKVSTEGYTDMVCGIEQAIQSMFDKSNGDCLDRPGSLRIFLFTDGIVNGGVQEELEIGSIVKIIQSNFGVNFTSFGFGTDFDENLMRLIASEGKGDYFYIDGVEDLNYKVSKGLEVLQSLFAINAKLSLFSVNNSSKNVTASIENVQGYDIVPGNATQVSLGDLCFDDLRQILLQLSISIPNDSSTTTTTPDSVEILQYNLSYLTLESNGGYSERQHDGCVCIEFTNDQSKLNQIPNSLKVAMTLKEVNVTDKKILTLVQGRDYEEAKQLAKSNLDALSSISEIDKTGVIIHMIARTKSIITKMENLENETLEKDVGYCAYQGGIVHRKCF